MVHWLLRAKKWAENPPSAKMVMFVIGVIVVVMAMVGYERIFGWPEALTVERARPPKVTINPN